MEEIKNTAMEQVLEPEMKGQEKYDGSNIQVL